MYLNFLMLPSVHDWILSFFPDCSSHQKTLHQRQLPPIIPSFFRLAFQGEGALVLATTLYLEATLIIVRSRTAHETKVKAKLIAGAPTPPCRHFSPFLPRIIQKIHGRRFWRSGSYGSCPCRPRLSPPPSSAAVRKDLPQ